jgi:Pup amidohydrolase
VEHDTQSRWPPLLPKICGADVELGNFIIGADGPAGTPGAAANALLRQIDGVPASSARAVLASCTCSQCTARREAEATGEPVTSVFDPQDQGRRFLVENGGCAYIDLEHLELCLPEVRSAFDHVACWHAMLRIARRALMAANAADRGGRQIQVLVNNRDGKGNSYGSHLDFLITRRAWDNIFCRRMHYLLYLAAYQVSSIVFTGQGKVGAENGQPPAAFQLSQRADFCETLTGLQTTFNRPIVNSRNEPLCAEARLHSIFFDSTLCHVASLLKVGVMQIVLAMIEAERVNPDLVVEDPLEALATWSRDPSLQQRVRLASGGAVTAVELQRRFFDDACEFAASGALEGVVPRAAEILTRWNDTLRLLEARDFAALAPRLDWVLKLSLIDRARRQRPDLDWDAPALRHLDHVYSSLDPADGLYWACEQGRAVELVVSDAAIERFMREPPEDTRAWTRAMVLRAFDRDRIVSVDWDAISVRDGRLGTTVRRIEMPNPAELGRGDVESAEASHETA